jgi:hypothetical protein
MIPEFVDIGGPWKVLPFGIHNASLEEIKERFAINPERRELFQGLLQACKMLKAAGCTAVYLDGSYITENPQPSDYDVCWNTLNVDARKVDKLFLNPTPVNREKQKKKYQGEFFPASSMANGSLRFIQFFQKDKQTGLEKGILCIHL